jgi:CHAT domain-containing protein/Tfp pilus assembly protein PilF
MIQWKERQPAFQGGTILQIVPLRRSSTALEVRRGRGLYQSLAGLAAPLLSFSLLAAVSSHPAFGRHPRLFRQSTQQARDKKSKDIDEKKIPKLRKSRPISSGLVMGQERAYRIELDAGKFLKVIVEQKGIDLTAEVSGPDGKQVMEFDSDSKLQGTEEVALVAEAKGDFRLILRSKQYGTPVGSYKIRIEELRDATEADRALQDARKQFIEAIKLRRAGKYDEALPPAERAMEIREKWLGTEHRDVAAAINLLANIYAEKGAYGNAEPLYLRALGIREKALGKDHPDTAKSLNDLATLYFAQGKYVEAEQLHKRALNIYEKALGGDHPDTVDSLTNLAMLYHTQGKYDEAEPLYARALKIREKALGTDHPLTANSLNDLAKLYYHRGKYVEAEALFKRALEIRETALGKDHPNVAQILNNLGALCQTQGKYDEAEPLLKRALDIGEKALGKDHPNTALLLDSLADLYRTQIKYEKAEPLYKRAIEIREKALGKDHPYTADSLYALAELYRTQEKYAEAEPLLKRAIEIHEKALGKDHPTTATDRDGLGALYAAQGKYGEAEAIYKRSLDITEKALGKDHQETALSLDTLASVYYYQGQYAKAEPLNSRALEIREKALGKDHPYTAASLNNVAKVYALQGKYLEAEPLYKRALDISGRALGKEHPYTLIGYNNLAQLYVLQGRYEEAEPLLKRALDIGEKALGKDHPYTADSLNLLALLYTAKGDHVQAVKFQSLANAARERNLARKLVVGSERTKLAYLGALSKQTDQTVSLHLISAPNDPEARNMAATVTLQRKGRALDATSQNLNALRNRFNAEDRALLDRLTETRARIARLVLSGPRKMTAEQHQARIKELEDQAEKDEADISRGSKEYLAQSLPVTLEAVRAAIPPDSALIEFATYRPFNAQTKGYGQPRYVAYVLRQSGEVEFAELGEAKDIDTAIASLRKALRDPKSVDVKSLARAVDEKVFQPIRPLLGGKSRLLISPDGSLNLIPFAALMDEKGQYAVERYSISYLTSGRDLLRLRVARESKDGPLVVAAPDFGRRSDVEASSLEQDASEGEIRTRSARSAIRDFYFPPLPAAEREGEALRELLPGATLLTEGRATKAALNKIQAPRLLHIATHGFFLEDQDFTPTGDGGYQPFSNNPERGLYQLEQRGIRIESPLLRSGLVLAGANEHKEDDNGILTALEVTGLNLWGTKLVTLSACDTGLGEVKNGDGVYGLRRALVLAGAETQIISLWSVSDRATQELMVSYYRKLQEGQGRGEGLRQAQLEMLKKENRRHPYYWACFIQSGEWANLDGKR